MSARPSNVRLWMALRRPPTPAIVPFLWESIDHCDPTRSHEAKPSARMREARYMRRMWRATFRFALACTALAALFSHLN